MGQAYPDPRWSLADPAAGVRTWLAERADVLEPYRHEYAEELAPAVARFRPLQAMLWDDGWNRLGWPSEVGGLGGSPVHRFVVAEELAAAGYVVPEVVGTVEIIAPMLVRYGPQRAAERVAACMRGDAVWGRGSFEPDG